MSSRPRWFSAFMRLWPLAEQADVVGSSARRPGATSRSWSNSSSCVEPQSFPSPIAQVQDPRSRSQTARLAELPCRIRERARRDDLVISSTCLRSEWAKWQVYRAPLHIEIDLPIDYERKRNSDVSTGPEDRYTITSAPESWGVRRHSFRSEHRTRPIHARRDFAVRVFRTSRSNQRDGLKLTDQQVKRYALKDLDVLLSDWQRAHRDRSQIRMRKSHGTWDLRRQVRASCGGEGRIHPRL